MNIQFMTAEKNGVPTGGTRWSGEPEYRYFPNYDELIANASCEEEIAMLEKSREIMTEGFVFEIVFTHFGNSYNSVKGIWENRWELLQHPWYEDAYTLRKHTIEEMMADINALVKELDKDAKRAEVQDKK